MTNEERIDQLAQDIYLTRNNQENDVTDEDLVDFRNQTISWINQYIPEMEKKADWNFVRTNDAVIGTVTVGTTISYPLPVDVRKLVINFQRDLTIRQDGTIITSFRLVNPNQPSNPNDHDIRDRATVLKRSLIFSRPLNDLEVGGDIVADTIAPIPRLSTADVSLLDILDEYPDIRQLFIYGVVKNQVLPDIIQGGLTPSFSQKYAEYLADCIAENNLSAAADAQDRDNFAFIGGVF